MFITLFLLLLLIGIGNSLPSYCTYQSTQIIRIIPETDEQIEELNKLTKNQWLHLEPWIKPSSPFVPALYSARTEMVAFVGQFCRKRGINFEVVINDVQENILKLNRISYSNTSPFKLELHPSKFDTSLYHSWDEIEAFMFALQRTYPDMCSVITSNELTTSEGLAMKILKISPPGRTNKKGIFIDAAIHAREWISASIATYIAHNLTVGYNTSEEIRHLVNDVTWYILPVFNVDGYVYSWRTDRMWRKSRSSAERCSSQTVKQDDPLCMCHGVDLNRNWNSSWNTSDSCTHPCCNTYPGTSPMSEKEVKGVASFLLKNQDKIQAYVSLHNYGQFWMYPYSHSDRKVARRAYLMHEIGEIAVKHVRNVHGTNYTLGSSFNTLYQYSGSSTDWVIDNTNITLAYIVETRPNIGGYESQTRGFCLEESEIRPTSEEIFEGIKVVAKAIVGKVNVTGRYGKYFKSLAERSLSSTQIQSFSYYFCILLIGLLLLI